jgi:hypothetical protein
MFYVGLDIHSKHISICVLSETGQVIRRAKVRAVSLGKSNTLHFLSRQISVHSLLSG